MDLIRNKDIDKQDLNYFNNFAKAYNKSIEKRKSKHDPKALKIASGTAKLDSLVSLNNKLTEIMKGDD